MKWKTFRFPILLVMVTCFVMVCGNAMAGVSIINMRYFVAPDHTRIVFDLTAPPVYKTTDQDGTLSIIFQGTTCADTVPRETGINKAGIGNLAVIALNEGDVLVRLELSNDTETNVFPLKKFLDKPDRLVIDVELPEVSKQESLKREQIKASKKKKIIVIDPGHGGDDPGAVGKRGTYEKDVVLAISHRLKKTLDRHGFYQAYLTRNGDYYVPFNKRLQIAREYGADLFISIHADAARNRNARGCSVYCLSTGEASSVAANLLAQNENLADIVGGVQDVEMVEETNPILINMCQTNTINVSKAFGMSVLWELSNVGELKFNKVQEAPFRVLKMPEIPAVLIETAYISNPKEEKLLRSTAFQKKIADSISRTVLQFFEKDFPREGQGVALAEKVTDDNDSDRPVIKKNLPRPFFLYTVVKGDTLTNIAGRFGSSVKEVAEMNGLKVDAPLYVGKRLKIQGGTGNDEVALRQKEPDKSAEEPEKKKVFFYTVARGDNLTRIADRFGVPMADLLEMNELKADAPLYIGKRLKIVGEQGDSTEPNRSVAEKPDKETFFIYTVAKGDSLSRIAERFNVSLGNLLETNGLKMNAPLHVGKRLKIQSGDGNGEVVSRQKETDSRAEQPEKKRVFFYTVVRGDNLTRIADRFGMPLADLLEMNGVKANTPLYVGKRLKIVGKQEDSTEPDRSVAEKPGKETFFIYTVAKGDSLSRIAERFNVSLNNLLETNDLKTDAPLYVGKRLKIEGTDIKAKQGDETQQKRRSKRDYRTYRVKKGDTLLAIAHEQGVSVTTLLELNKMKLNDPLYLNRVLVVGFPSNP